VERSDASEKARGESQAKEPHVELQATTPCQDHQANDGFWQFIRTGSKHQYNTEVAIDVMSARAAAAEVTAALFFVQSSNPISRLLHQLWANSGKKRDRLRGGPFSWIAGSDQPLV